jgi:hypothetical protein
MSKLEDYLSNELFTRFGQYSIRRNYFPDWLRTSTGARMQLDFYIDELKMAAEVQGEQHYKFIPHFHVNMAGFEALQKRDKDKAFICEQNGIELYEIFTYVDADLFVSSVKEKQEPDDFYQIPQDEEKILNENNVDPRLRLLARKTRRSILRHRQEDKINKLVAQLLQKCTDYKSECYIPEIVDYYIANKKAVDVRVKNSKCPYCEKDNFFGELSLVEHIEAKHSEYAPPREKKQKIIKEPKTKKINDPSKKLLGSQRQRRDSKKLFCEKITDISWKVWGGRDTHIINLVDEILVCDCWHSVNKKTDCVHTIKIKGTFKR